jgi:hypothetical protein
VSQQSAGPTVGRVIRARRVVEPTIRRVHRTVSGVHRTVSGVHRTVSGVHRTVSGVHRTVSGVHRTMSGAPTARNLQRSASPNKERDPHRTVSGGAPDCPVRQLTEGKNCLLEMLSTAPSCLGAIKGTPRRMEENTKHSLSIVDHSHFMLAHLFDILSDLSSVLVRTL